MHGSESWSMKVEHELKLNRTEMSMIRWMCEVKLNERKTRSSADADNRLNAFSGQSRSTNMVPFHM